MILQALHALYYRKQDEMPPQGFEFKELPFLIVINGEGRFVSLQDTRTKVGRKLIGRKYLVPKELGRSGSNAWKTSNLLWDHYGYILAWPKSDVKADKEMAAKQHGSFKKAISILASQYPANPEINAVNQFLGQTDFSDIFACQEWEECKKIKGCNLSFVLEGMNRLVCENNDVKSYITENEDGNDEADETETLQEREGICLVTGERASIARLNPRTPILGTKSNAKIVAFQKNMGFDSYGKEQSFNAPVSKSATFAYSTALNFLLAKESKQKLLIGDATAVFWAEKSINLKMCLLIFLANRPKMTRRRTSRPWLPRYVLRRLARNLNSICKPNSMSLDLRQMPPELPCVSGTRTQFNRSLTTSKDTLKTARLFTARTSRIRSLCLRF